MIFTKQQGDLQHSINRMALPVFVVDQGVDGQFRVSALNAAHTKATGLQLDAVLSKTPDMILPNRKDAEFLINRYRTCIQLGKPIEYSTNLTYQDSIQRIRTTLHPVSLDGAAPTRLVGEVAVTALPTFGAENDVLGGQGVLAKADLQAIEAIFENIRSRQRVCSKDLMLLAVLMKNRSLSLSEVTRLVEDFDLKQKGPRSTEAKISQALLADLSRASMA
jgi:hypothetical protein